MAFASHLYSSITELPESSIGILLAAVIIFIYFKHSFYAPN